MPLTFTVLCFFVEPDDEEKVRANLNRAVGKGYLVRGALDGVRKSIAQNDRIRIRVRSPVQSDGTH